ncbi:MAG: 3-phosphoglycerate dehydrogenase [Micromonosporaceae bacterium]|nr:3-phosphoglycerate dehydrogenase [Micromonosporaceae bacterium]
MTTLITKRLPYLATTERMLSSLGPVVYAEDISAATLRAAARDATIVIATKGAVIDDDLLDAAPKVRVIAAPTAGYEWIDVSAATRRGIPVIANTGAAADSVASFAVGVVLAFSRRIVAADRALRSGQPWSEVRARYATVGQAIGTDLTNATVGIVGLGHIGRKVAEKLAIIRPRRIVGYDPYVTADDAQRLGVELGSDLLTVARQSDVLLVHVPLVPATRHLINREVIAALGADALLVNCSRGEVVDEPALIEALRTGQLGGAALDVFTEEPLPANSPLLGLDNVILTPHIAGVTRESDEVRAREIAERILTCLDGTRPVGLVNPEVWPPSAAWNRDQATAS